MIQPLLHLQLSGWALGLATLLGVGLFGSLAAAQPPATNSNALPNTAQKDTLSGGPVAEGLKVDLAALTQENRILPPASTKTAAAGSTKTSDVVRGLMAAEATRTAPTTPAATAATPSTLIQAGDMIGFSRDLGDGVQAITIINASLRWMAVYHIDTSGQIRLTSSRPLQSDFTLQFNATSPLPEEIRRLQRK
jgi:hypothetical protein